MTITFGMRSFPHIFSTLLQIMGYILLVNMYYSNQMCAFSELLTMTIDPSE